MPLTRNSVLLKIEEEISRWRQIHHRNAPTGGRTPVGGGEWMDSFFKMQALRGLQGGLRKGMSLSRSLDLGKEESKRAVEIWNSQREYQVHRCEQTAWSYLENFVLRFKKISFKGQNDEA